MNWKEQLTEEIEEGRMSDWDGISTFISTEIIEKLIADIPDIPGGEATPGRSVVNHLKQYLRDKWL